MCKSIRFSSEFSGTIFDNIIKSGKVFGPSGLMSGEEFCGIEVFKGLVICNNLDLVYRSLKIGTPFLESRKDCEEFFIMDFVVKLSGLHGSGEEGDRMDFIGIGVELREDCSNSIVRCIGFYDGFVLRLEMS